MWSPTTGANVVVGAMVVEVVVVVGVMVVEVVVEVDDDVLVEAVVGMMALSEFAACHWDSTYDAAPPTMSAVTTRSTMPTLRLERPP
jgi:hypothetical protein